MSSADSLLNWSKLTLMHTVAPGAPEVGQPLGVGLFIRRGTAVDDVTLDVIPEPASVILVGLSGLSLLGVRRRR
jgi:hypothetical protein